MRSEELKVSVAEGPGPRAAVFSIQGWPGATLILKEDVHPSPLHWGQSLGRAAQTSGQARWAALNSPE